MRALTRFLRCYMRLNAYYRFEFVMQFIRDALMMYVMFALWNVLFDYGMGYKGATRMQVVVYGVYGALLTTFVTRDGCQTYIRERIRQGTVDADLLKPMHLQNHMLMRDFSMKFSRLLQFTLPTLALFSLMTRLFYAPDPAHLGLFLVSALLAYGVLFGINFLFGLLCFYTLSIENISFCYTAVVSFLAGQMVPLWMFPGWAQTAVGLLPFRCIFDVPMSIFIGRVTAQQGLLDIGLQALWVAALGLLGRWAWAGIRKHVISQGG